jgi:hypothetical protein
MTRKKDRSRDAHVASVGTVDAEATAATKRVPARGSLHKASPKKPRDAPERLAPSTPGCPAEATAMPWSCEACGHEHMVTRRTAEKHAECARCSCVRGDVVHAHRHVGVLPLLAERPLRSMSFRCFGDAVDVASPKVTPNPHASPGTRLYARFLRAYAKSKGKSVKVMFHGTSARAAVSICVKGMDPSMRLSGGDWFTSDTTYALSRAISREEYAVASANTNRGSSSANDKSPPVHQRSKAISNLENGPPGPWSTAEELKRAAPRKSAHDGALPPTRTVRVVAVAVLLDDCTTIGDHVVVKNHHHALPLFVVDFTRERMSNA